MHAAFVNTKWYEAWSGRTLLLVPIFFDMWCPGVLSWAPGDHCNSHHARHTGQETLVVLYLRCGFFLYHKSVGGRGCGQQPDAFFSNPELPRRRGESIVGVRVHHSFWLCLTPSLFVCFPQSIVITCVSRRVSSMLVFPAKYRCFCVSVFFCFRHSTRTQFCTHRCSRITESTVFKRTHHKDRRHLQLFPRLALHDRTASCACAHSRHICSISFCFCVPTERVRLACAKPKMSREVDQDPEGGLTRQCNARPIFLITCCVWGVWETPSQFDVTFHNDYDELEHSSMLPSTMSTTSELPEHEVREPEDAHQGGKPCLIC